MAMLEQFQGVVSKAFNLNKGESVIGLDIGTSFIKVVQLRKEGQKAVLETYGELDLGPYARAAGVSSSDLSPVQIAEAVRALFADTNITAKAGAIAVPLDSTLLSLIELPRTSEEEMAKIIPMEARKHIPVSLGEVSLDWWVVPQRDDDSIPRDREDFTQEEKEEYERRKKMAEVLIVAIHNNELEKYNEVIRRIALEDSSMEVETFSAVRSTLAHDMAPFMLLDMGATGTKFSLVDRGVIRSSHIINKGSKNITDEIAESFEISAVRAEERKIEVGLLGADGDDLEVSRIAAKTADEILSEANRVLLNYQMKNERIVTKVVLVGGGVLLKGFMEKAQQGLSTDVVYGNSFSSVEAPQFLNPVLSETGPEFAVAVGLALRRLQVT